MRGRQGLRDKGVHEGAGVAKSTYELATGVQQGPPELPGLMAASVWITFSMGRPVLPELISLPATCVRLLNVNISFKSMPYHFLWPSFPVAALI